MATRKKKAKKPAARKAAGRRAAKRTPAKRASAKPAFKQRRQPETLRLRAAAPAYTVNDLTKSLAWYRDVLGFVVGERWEHEGKLAGVEVRAGSIAFMLSQDDWKKGRGRVKGEGFRIYCTSAQSVDDLARWVKARGGRLLQEPRDQPWGVRDIAVADPDGFKITIANES